MIVLTPWSVPLNLGCSRFESSIIFVLHLISTDPFYLYLHMLSDRGEGGGTYLIVSDGVTAIMASIIPAPRPANIVLGADSFPYHRSAPPPRVCGTDVCILSRGRGTYLIVTEHRLELIVCREPNTRLDSISEYHSADTSIKTRNTPLRKCLPEHLIRR